MSLENYHEEHEKKQEKIQKLVNTLEQRKDQLLQKENITQEELIEVKNQIESEIDKKAQIAEHIDDDCLLSIAHEMKAIGIDLPVEKKQEIYHSIKDIDYKIIQTRVDAKIQIDKIIKVKNQDEEKLNYENILKQPMPIPGTAEYRERQNFIAHDISRRAGDIKIDEFTYFEELEEYIDKNPLFKQEDKNFAYKALKRIKDVIPKIEKTAEKYIKEINTDTRTKNLFRSYLMINRLIGQNETSATNSLSKESFENIVAKSKNNSNIFDLDIFKNKDIQEYLKQDFNPEEYKKYYKEFTEQRLLTENKDNIKKYIKIQSIINSPKWQEIWNNVA